MTIREEFNEAFEAENVDLWSYPKDIALWAAEWTLTKISNLWQEGKFTTEELSKMMRELDKP